ncbi:phosphonate ABC transporter ATP-binding protein [Oricola thermophila]|uniref:Phosphonate ABC transporter ATP-binding protein n=1 Tax=Oricola thermophila TaxID=2742145 RepID=A0A6N1VD66_9HYPH|nr:phosphonate ABC transporter ATP-binding protein [Oricola thermophila]QKV17535.1 phosphonate ABC transporter ATP-binding protein [Oricola thermophila]
MLEIRNVTRRFGANTAVKSVDLRIPTGQMVGIIGASGAGKSTLLRMINRLIDPSEGSILFEGREVSSLKGKALRSWHRDCAMVFQQFNLVPRLDVVSNVMHGLLNERSTLATIFNVWPRADILRAIDILERLGVGDHAVKRAEALSGGQQQRVAIARALMQQPKVVLADEPIASLDPRNAQIVMQSLRDINRQDGLTVITNLHTLDTARAFCERIIGMSAGEVVFDGTPEDLTEAAARRIYGADGLDEAFSESVTSTSFNAVRETVAPKPEPEVLAAQP